MAGIKNSVYFSEDIQKWVDTECVRYGIGKSAFVSMVLVQYRQQMEAVQNMSKVDLLINRLDEIVSNPDNYK